jgi:hypothetical protein
MYRTMLTPTPSSSKDQSISTTMQPLVARRTTLGIVRPHPPTPRRDWRC